MSAATNIWDIKTTAVRVERRFEAVPERVFEAWLDPACPGSPWHSPERTLLTPEVDGLFYCMHLSKDKSLELPFYGRFTAMEPPRRLQFTWVSQHTRGIESLVTLEFKAQGSKATVLTLTHENLPDDEKGRMHEGGWQYYMGLMQEAVQAHTQGA